MNSSFLTAHRRASPPIAATTPNRLDRTSDMVWELVAGDFTSCIRICRISNARFGSDLHDHSNDMVESFFQLYTSPIDRNSVDFQALEATTSGLSPASNPVVLLYPICSSIQNISGAPQIDLLPPPCARHAEVVPIPPWSSWNESAKIATSSLPR